LPCFLSCAEVRDCLLAILSGLRIFTCFRTFLFSMLRWSPGSPIFFAVFFGLGCCENASFGFAGVGVKLFFKNGVLDASCFFLLQRFVPWPGLLKVFPHQSGVFCGGWAWWLRTE